MEKEKAMNNVLLALGEIIESRDSDIYWLQLNNKRKAEEVEQLKQELENIKKKLKDYEDCSYDREG